MNDLTRFETPYWNNSRLVLGLDEAGRGPLAGPVVVAGVILPINTHNDLINDSKKLTQKKRNELFNWIINQATYINVKVVLPEEIDTLNIYRATQKAMEDIALESGCDCVLSDAMPLLLGCDFQAIIKGDAKSISIASASIVAKVVRDRIMMLYDRLYPQYQFKKHKGYPTKVHYEAIKAYGILPIHRKSFKLIKE